MKTPTLLALAVMLSLGVTSCRKVYFSDGKQVEEYRDIDTNFTEIHLEGSIDLIISQSDEYRLKIEGGERMIPYIETRVFEDRLEISEKPNSIERDDPVRVFVSKAYLDDIYLLGSGDIDGSGLIAGHADLEVDGSGDMDIQFATLQTLDLKIDGSGDARVTADSDQTTFRIEGSGDIDARYLNSTDAFIYVDGSGDTRLTVSNYLNVEINGSGDVLYWGDPADIDAEVQGSGDLIDME